MKRIYTLLILLFGIGTLGFAQATNDPDAKKILDAVSAKFKSFKTVKATFTYKVENAAGKAISTKKGTVYMKGTKYSVTLVARRFFVMVKRCGPMINLQMK